MIVSNISESTLRFAAQTINVAIDLHPLSASGRRFRVKLYPLVPPDAYTKSRRRKRATDTHPTRGDAPYQRTSTAIMFRENRRVSAVCWHGFRDFFRACFLLEPNARFATAVDTWKGSDDFESRYRESGQRNIGSQYTPIAHAEACRCPESGYAS